MPCDAQTSAEQRSTRSVQNRERPSKEINPASAGRILYLLVQRSGFRSHPYGTVQKSKDCTHVTSLTNEKLAEPGLELRSLLPVNVDYLLGT